MYHYVTDKEFISNMRQLGGDILQDLCHTLKEDYDMGFQFFLVGSGKRKLITQNSNKPVDLDYNLLLVRCDNFYDCKTIKENARKSLNKTLKEYKLRDCEDSTSALTTKEIYFTKGNPTAFKIDIAIIVQNDDGTYDRLIHDKHTNRYYWVQAPNSKNLFDKVEYIKKHRKWDNVTKQYLDIKNRYLCQNDYNHPSFVCFAEAVNNVYNSRGHW